MGAVAVLALLSVPALTPAPVAPATDPGTVPAIAAPEDAATARPAGSAAASKVSADDRDTAKPLPHRIYLDEPQHGALALAALGENLGEVAALNAMSAAELRALLERDTSLWLGRDGRAFYADPVTEFADPGPENVSTTTDNAAMAIYPESQTFQLHSLPGSTKTIFLDFDGITLGKSYWTDPAYSSTPLSKGAYAGFSLDANPAFNSAEKTYIQTVWRIVAEKYATFDVDVTTEDPGPAAYNRATLADDAYGAHVAITSATGIANQVCSGGCAGIALIGTFKTPLDHPDHWSLPESFFQPAWVFATAGQSAYVTANVASHEVGHHLGLLHDGDTSGTDYYQGQGNWVPVMGQSTTDSKSVVQFDRGEYAGAANVTYNNGNKVVLVSQNDFTVMTSVVDSFATDGSFLINGGGLTRRSDSVADSPAQADNPSAPVLGPITTTQVEGVIETQSDVDVVRIDHRCDGDLTVAAEGIGPGGTLDIQLELLDPEETVLAIDDPAWQPEDPTNTPVGMDANLTMPALPAGTYYARVDGVGRGTPTGDGYSDYGSVGQYRITTDDCGPPAPTDVVAEQTSTSNGTVSWTPPEGADDAVTGYRISGLPGADLTVPSTTTSIAISGLEGGRDYPISVKSVNNYGVSDPAYDELVVPTWSPTAAPTLTPRVAGSDVSLTWTPPPNPGNATLDGWDMAIYDVADDSLVLGETFEDPDTDAWQPTVPLDGGTYRAVLTLHTTAEQQTDVPTAEATFSVVGAPTGLVIDGFTRGATTLSWTAPAGPVAGYRVDGLPDGPVITSGTSLPLQLHGNDAADLTVVSLTDAGESVPSDPPLHILVPTWQPGEPPAASVSTRGQRTVVAWTRPDNPGKATLTGWRLDLSPATADLGRAILPATATSASFMLPPGNYSMRLTPLYSAVESGNTPSTTMPVSVRATPSAPRIKKAKPGKRGKPVTVKARWKPPAAIGNSPITGYVVVAKRVGPKGKKTKTRKKIVTSPLLGSATRSYVLRLPKGKYKVRVVAYNSVGASPPSRWSKKVTAR